MRPFLITPPADTPVVPLSDLARFVRDTSGEEDDQLSASERAAVGMLDGWHGRLGRCILVQTWGVEVAEAPSDLPYPFGADAELGFAQRVGGDWVPVSGGSVSGGGLRVMVDELPSGDGPFAVTFTSGWARPQDVPDPLRQAIKMMTAYLFDHRDGMGAAKSMTGLPPAVEALIRPYIISAGRS